MDRLDQLKERIKEARDRADQEREAERRPDEAVVIHVYGDSTNVNVGDLKREKK